MDCTEEKRSRRARISGCRREISDEENTHEVENPSESLRSSSRSEREVRERSEEPRRDDGDPGNSPSVRLRENLRELAIERHGDNDTSSDVAVGVTGGPGGDEDTRVDDRGEGRDSSGLDGDNPGRRVGVSGARN